MKIYSGLLSITIFLLLPMYCWNQESTHIEGYVCSNDKISVNYALAILLAAEDSSIISSSQTDLNGYFSFQADEEAKTTHFILRISHLNYHDTYVSEFQNGDTIFLEQKNFQIEKVIVIGNPKEIRKKDTITYNIKYYEDSTEQNLEELIGKLPGMTVDRNSGEIKVNNRSIKTILLEGDDVSESNYKAISKNMPAHATGKIQVLYDYVSRESEDDVPSVALNVVLDTAYQNKIYGTIQAGIGYPKLHNYNLDAFYISKNFKSIAFAGYNNLGTVNSQFRNIEGNESDNYYFPAWHSMISMSDGPSLQIVNRNLTAINDALLVNKSQLSSQIQTQYKWGENNKLYFTIGWSKESNSVTSNREFDDRVLDISANLEDNVFSTPILFNSRVRLFSDIGRGVKMNLILLKKQNNSFGSRIRKSIDFFSYDFENINSLSENLGQLKFFKKYGENSTIIFKTFGYSSHISDVSKSKIYETNNLFAQKYNNFQQNLLLKNRSFSASTKYQYKEISSSYSAEIGYLRNSPQVSSQLSLENRNNPSIDQFINDTFSNLDYLLGVFTYEKLNNSTPIVSFTANLFYNQNLSNRILANVVLGWNYKFSGYNIFRVGVRYGFNLPTYQSISHDAIARDVNHFVTFPATILPDYSFSSFITFNGNIKNSSLVYDANFRFLRRIRSFFNEYSASPFGIIYQNIIPRENLQTHYSGNFTLSNYFKSLAASISIAPYFSISSNPTFLNGKEVQNGALNTGLRSTIKTVLDIPVNIISGVTYDQTKYDFQEFGLLSNLELFSDITLKWKKHNITATVDYFLIRNQSENIQGSSTALIANLGYRTKIRNKFFFNLNIRNLGNVPTFVENFAGSLVFRRYSYNLLSRRMWIEVGYSF